jgi:hypothetical protein
MTQSLGVQASLAEAQELLWFEDIVWCLEAEPGLKVNFAVLGLNVPRPEGVTIKIRALIKKYARRKPHLKVFQQDTTFYAMIALAGPPQILSSSIPADAEQDAEEEGKKLQVAEEDRKLEEEMAAAAKKKAENEAASKKDEEEEAANPTPLLTAATHENVLAPVSTNVQQREVNVAIPASSRVVFIGGLHTYATELDLKAEFETFGELTDVVVMRCKMTQKSLGYGFVTFKDAAHVGTVLADKENQKIRGRTVDVKIAKWRGEMEVLI